MSCLGTQKHHHEHRTLLGNMLMSRAISICQEALDSRLACLSPALHAVLAALMASRAVLRYALLCCFHAADATFPTPPAAAGRPHHAYSSTQKPPAHAEGCRKVVQERVLNEMLGSIQDPTGGGWKVLVLDSVTTRILSSAMRMSDILEAGGKIRDDGMGSAAAGNTEGRCVWRWQHDSSACVRVCRCHLARPVRTMVMVWRVLHRGVVNLHPVVAGCQQSHIGVASNAMYVAHPYASIFVQGKPKRKRHRAPLFCWLQACRWWRILKSAGSRCR